MVWWRIGLGYAVAVAIGLIIHFGPGGSKAGDILHDAWTAPTCDGQHHCDCGHDHGEHAHHHSLGQKIQALLDHAAAEFFDVIKYFIVGSGLAAVSQALINRQMLEAIGGGTITSVLVMIAFAIVICICSEADAFVAATFASTFTPGALLAFLVVGPMTDIKNTMMMLASFRKPFVVYLNMLIIGLTGLATIGLNLFTVTRLVVTCHVAHAYPDGLLAYIPGKPRPAQDTWHRVEGVLEPHTFKGASVLRIRVDKLTPIPKPADPYVYP
jgi:uncharacterized membrane protein YraQ (UPF0718 family)